MSCLEGGKTTCVTLGKPHWQNWFWVWKGLRRADIYNPADAKENRSSLRFFNVLYGNNPNQASLFLTSVGLNKCVSSVKQHGNQSYLLTARCTGSACHCTGSNCLRAERASLYSLSTHCTCNTHTHTSHFHPPAKD